MNVLLRSNSLDIGGQTYPLRNIARVSALRYTIEPERSLGKTVGFAILGLFLVSLGDTGILIGLAFWVAAAYYGWRTFGEKPKAVYSLRLETSGNPADAVYSHNETAVK